MTRMKRGGCWHFIRVYSKSIIQKFDFSEKSNLRSSGVPQLECTPAGLSEYKGAVSRAYSRWGALA
jgi:hypothetical protein